MRTVLLTAAMFTIGAWAQSCQQIAVSSDLPNGQMARGINIYADDLMQQGAQAVTSTFPGINFLRVNIFNLTTYSATRLAPLVNQLTSAGVRHDRVGGSQLSHRVDWT